jgi:16S rRNA (uracil1498-N3)-methyltransferase
MESLRPAAGPPLFLVPPGGLTAQVMTLTGPEGHHAAAVRRLRTGERADVGDGAGTIAEGVVSDVGKNTVTLDIHAVHTVPPPRPLLTVAQALPKGDRGELAVELMTEIGVDAVIPWAAERSITKWHAERGDKALAKWRACAREAAKQSRRAWLPEIMDLATTAALAQRVAAATRAIVLEADAPAKLHELPLPDGGEILLLVGPEGGISPAERAALRESGAVEARLGPTVLRTSTAGAAAATILLSRVGRWLGPRGQRAYAGRERGVRPGPGRFEENRLPDVAHAPVRCVKPRPSGR